MWPDIRDGGWLKDVLVDELAVAYWTDVFDKVYRDEIDTWDYQWTFACWVQSGLTILPARNLVENIGTGADATHTAKPLAHMPGRSDLEFPLNHPPFVIRDADADAETQGRNFHTGANWQRLRRWISALLPKPT
jgi:hypothetical protein